MIQSSLSYILLQITIFKNLMDLHGWHRIRDDAGKGQGLVAVL